MPSPLLELDTKSLGHLNYLHSVLTQPLGSWGGFYMSHSASMNFALRYQLAFAAYAVASIAQQTPAYRALYTEALRGAIDKILDVASWGYWHAPSQDGGSLSQSHAAILISPHSQASPGPPSDPIARDNLQYSGHLSTMLGLYEKLSGDNRYDNPFTLADAQSGISYTYDHSQVAERIHVQMKENRFGGVCCEPGMAYVPCNNYAMASNTLHDTLHGTTYSLANREWLKTVRNKMVLKAPTLRGIFGASYVKDAHLATPVAFNFTDAWGLAFLLPFAPGLVRKLYSPFRKRVTRNDLQQAYVGSSSLSEKMEISDIAINTGFGMVLARGVGDNALAEAMHRYAEHEFDAGWQENQFFYKGASRTLQSTALYALAATTDTTSLYDLFLGRSFTLNRDEPYLDSLMSPSGRVGVSQAVYDRNEHTLRIGLRLVGEPSDPALQTSHAVTLRVKGLKPHVTFLTLEGPVSEDSYRLTGDGLAEIDLQVKPGAPTLCLVKLEGQ